MPEFSEPIPGVDVPLAMGEPRSKRDEQKNDRMLRKAMRQGWAVPDQYKRPMIDRQVAIAINAEGPAREATAAFVALTSADLRERALELKELALEQGRYLPGEAEAVSLAASKAAAAAVANQTVVVNVQPAVPAEKEPVPPAGVGELSAEERLAALERILGEFGVAKDLHGRNGTANGSANGSH